MLVVMVTQPLDGRPVEHSEVHFRANAVTFSISLGGAGQPDQHAVQFQEHRVFPQTPGPLIEVSLRRPPICLAGGTRENLLRDLALDMPSDALVAVDPPIVYQQLTA